MLTGKLLQGDHFRLVQECASVMGILLGDHYKPIKIPGTFFHIEHLEAVSDYNRLFHSMSEIDRRPMTVKPV